MLCLNVRKRNYDCDHAEFANRYAAEQIRHVALRKIGSLPTFVLFFGQPPPGGGYQQLDFSAVRIVDLLLLTAFSFRLSCGFYSRLASYRYVHKLFSSWASVAKAGHAKPSTALCTDAPV